jgi:hypothetical protein
MAQFSENKVIEHKSMFWFSVPETSLTPTVQYSITIMYAHLHMKYLALLSYLNIT